MKFSRTKLIEHAKRKLAELEAKNKPDMSKYHEALKEYKVKLIEYAEAYHKAVKHYAKNGDETMSFTQQAPRVPEKPYAQHNGEIQRLKACIAQLELCIDENIEVGSRNMPDLFYMLGLNA